MDLAGHRSKAQFGAHAVRIEDRFRLLTAGEAGNRVIVRHRSVGANAALAAARVRIHRDQRKPFECAAVT